jgi:DNA sulfur modification protein DndD
MIIEKVTIENFGLFKERSVIDLMPDTDKGKNIIVVSGKNGVGKSTLQEAIHIALLGSLAVDTRMSESGYEQHLLSKCYRNSKERSSMTSVTVDFQFVKSGMSLRYSVTRKWNNNPEELDETVDIVEDGKLFADLSKKEKNFFLRELIQPGFAKIMFFDGELLSSLFESSNLSQFIKEGCQDLFGLNFVEILKADIGYLTNKLLTQQGNTKNIDDTRKVQDQLAEIDEILNKYISEHDILNSQLSLLKQSVALQEDEIGKQGRWMTKRLDKIKIEKQTIENRVQVLKKEVIELYTTLGPFVFCKNLCKEVRKRLLVEREIEKWFHAKELLNLKAKELEHLLSDQKLMSEMQLTKRTSGKLLTVLNKALLSKPASFMGEETIHHHISDDTRSRIISWIDLVSDQVSKQLKEKTVEIQQSEERLKLVNKEQSTFSKDDIVQPLIKQLLDLNKQIGATEQKIISTNKRITEQLTRKAFYTNQLGQLQARQIELHDANSKLYLAHKTKLALEDYSKELLTKKIQLLEEGISQKFNLLCRKDDYLDSVTIDPVSFHVTLKITGVITEHKQLSAGEKQLFILSLLWSLRQLTNVRLPLIIDTPIARLDQEHRISFICDFLPAIYPQVVLMGTDTEIMDELLEPVEASIAHQYEFIYDYKNISNRVLLKEQTAVQQTA